MCPARSSHLLRLAGRGAARENDLAGCAVGEVDEHFGVGEGSAVRPAGPHALVGRGRGAERAMRFGKEVRGHGRERVAAHVVVPAPRNISNHA